MIREEIMAYSKQQLLDPSNVLEAFQADTNAETADLLNAFTERAEYLRCAQKVKALIAATRKDVNAKSKLEAQKSNKTEFTKCPLGNLDCGSWIANDKGIKMFSDRGDIIACYHPIIPKERLCNIETKTEKITLAYKRDEVWEEITVDKDLIASSNKIVKLASYGISVTSENARYLVRYLSDVENMNKSAIKLKNSTSKYGWHNNYKDFIPYDTTVIFDDESRFKELNDSLNTRGTLDSWLELVREVRQNKEHPEPQIYLAASFASVLISKLNMLPFIVNLWGSTGKGKTVALMMAASVWADPSEGKYITDSYATQNAFEIRCDILNHFPLMLDDLSKVKDKCEDNFTDLVYLLCSGKGKDRSNIDLGLNKMKTWQNTILSNMERPLANETMRGGAINRILDFEMQEGYIFQNGNKVVDRLKNNFGHAGRRFIEIIKNELSTEYLENLRKEFEDKIKEESKKQGSEKEEKQILPLSILLTADKIATDMIFEDGIYLDLSWTVSQLKDVNEVSEGQRAYEAIIDTTAQFKVKFMESDVAECWGTINAKEGCVNILPTAFKKIAQDNNFSQKAFCSWAKGKELLNLGKDGRATKNCWVNGSVRKCYSIKLPNADGDCDFHEPDDKDDLPFK